MNPTSEPVTAAAVAAKLTEAAEAEPPGSASGEVLRQALRDLAWVDLLRGARAKRERIASAMATLTNHPTDPTRP